MKKSAGAALAAAMLLLALQSAVALEPSPPKPPLATVCPGAAAWNAEHADQLPAALQRADDEHPPSDAKLSVEIASRFDDDQRARRAYLADRRDDAALRTVQDVDADNLRWLLRLLKRQGMPSVEQVGRMGLHRLWLLTHHADTYPDLQAAALRDFERLHAAGAVVGDDLAHLTDRVLVNRRQPQRYGTQHDWSRKDVVLSLDPSEREAIDENRRQLGLMPLADYGCLMHFFRGTEWAAPQPPP